MNNFVCSLALVAHTTRKLKPTTTTATSDWSKVGSTSKTSYAVVLRSYTTSDSTPFFLSGSFLYDKNWQSQQTTKLITFYLRGGVIIEKRENFGLFPKWGKNKQKCLKFKFEHLKTHGGVPIFQKCLNDKLLSDPILKMKN